MNLSNLELPPISEEDEDEIPDLSVTPKDIEVSPTKTPLKKKPKMERKTPKSHEAPALIMKKLTNLPCGNCSFIGKTPAGLKRHETKCLQNKDKENVSECHQCSFETSNPEMMKVHKKDCKPVSFSAAKKSEKPRLVCKFCSFSTHFQAALNKHQKKHEDKKIAIERVLLQDSPPREKMQPTVFISKPHHAELQQR